jgi:tetratricopeptide (TPR) repeat protein
MIRAARAMSARRILAQKLISVAMLYVASSFLFSSGSAHASPETFDIDHLSADQIWESQIQWLKDGGWERGVYFLKDGKWIEESSVKKGDRITSRPKEPRSNDLNGWIGMGNDADEKGETAKAEKIWSDALAKVDNHSYTLTKKDITEQHLSWLLRTLGRTYYMDGRDADAKPILERMVKLQKSYEDNPYECLELATVYKRLGEIEKAKQLYQTLIDKFENYIYTTKALIGYAQLYESQKQYAKAEELLKKAVSVSTRTFHEGECENAYIALAHLYCLQRLDDAVKKTLDEAMKGIEGGYAHDEESQTHYRAPKCMIAFAHCFEEHDNFKQAEHYLKLSMYGYHFLPQACKQYAALMQKEDKSSDADLWLKRAQEAQAVDWRASDHECE